MTENVFKPNNPRRAGRTPVRDAYEAHEKYWTNDNGAIELPVDPFRIAAAMGIKVVASTLGQHESGFLAYTTNGPVIFVNEDHSITRQRFTCAHELGHFSDQKKRGIEMPSFRNERSAQGTDIEEIYANRFAAALLMPKASILRLKNAGLTVEEMARRFNVSEAAMNFRLTNLKIATK